jgi:hypothetical protein
MEDDLALQTNHAGDLANDDDDEQVFGSEQMAEYSTENPSGQFLHLIVMSHWLGEV